MVSAPVRAPKFVLIAFWQPYHPGTSREISEFVGFRVILTGSINV